jgi:Ala-tRNA(Pro) deacylase
MPISRTVNSYVERNKVEYALVTHPRTLSASRTAQAAHVSGDQVAKGVVLKDGDGHLLAVLPASRELDVDALNRILGRSLALADEGEFSALFNDCDTGAVPAVGPAFGIETAVDEALLAPDEVYFEAGDHQNLVRVKGEDFARLLDKATRGHFSRASH